MWWFDFLSNLDDDPVWFSLVNSPVINPVIPATGGGGSVVPVGAIYNYNGTIPIRTFDGVTIIVGS